MNEFDEMAASWDEDPSRIKRASVIAQRLRTVLDMSKFQRALEYGSGTGLLSFALKNDLNQVVLMDESAEMTRVASEKCEAAQIKHFHPVQMNLLKDRYATEEPFDLIFILLTLHHIDDTDGMLKRFREHMASGAVLALIDLETEDGSFHDREFHGHLGFDRQELEEKLGRAGFKPFHYEVVYEIEKGEGKDKRSYPLFLMLAQSH